ncbi:CPBP family intramembrane glutamic endopeptidase [Pontibacter sp. H259]|uniref:CPBP family intramembrane glutamic endopeptidase n=1 Tax=Pontibacter sp. H259 TaxID=3133421 RepID=UPI0030BA9957
MKNKSHLLVWVIGFVLLNLYFNGIPKLFTLDVLPWLAFTAGFFVVAHLFAKYVLRLKGLAAFGLYLQQGWLKLLLTGFILGLSIWALKYLVFYLMGKYEATGLMDSGYILGMLAQALLAMLLVSAINDVLVRGYWLPYFRKNNLMPWYLLVTTILYALDDFWNEGMSITNFAFSMVLGLSLAYTVVKTGNIWMAIGIHWGSNMMFRAMAGFDGQGIWKLQNTKDGAVYEWVSILITALLLPVVYALLRNRKPAPDPEIMRTTAQSKIAA